MKYYLLFINIYCLQITFGAEPRMGWNKEDELLEEESISKSLPPELKSSEAPLPRYVDNSNTIWFPPVVSQRNQSSCTAFAAGYYANSFANARGKNLDLRSGDPDHICSPAFIYHLINGGQDRGSSVRRALQISSNFGCASLTEMPYIVNDYYTWPTKKQYLNGYSKRTIGRYFFHDYDKDKADYYLSDDGIKSLKRFLAEGNLAVASADVYLWKMYSRNFPKFFQEAMGVGNGILHQEMGKRFIDGVGEFLKVGNGHAMTIVGYNDNKEFKFWTWDKGWITVRGAFLVVNSWGNDWGAGNTGTLPGGFIWVAYDMFKRGKSSWGFVAGSKYRTNQPLKKFVEIKLETSERNTYGYGPREFGLGCHFTDSENYVIQKSNRRLNLRHSIVFPTDEGSIHIEKCSPESSSPSRMQAFQYILNRNGNFSRRSYYYQYMYDWKDPFVSEWHFLF